MTGLIVHSRKPTFLLDSLLVSLMVSRNVALVPPKFFWNVGVQPLPLLKAGNFF